MNKIVLKLSIIYNKLALFSSFCFLVGTIISFYLSIIISTYFYLLAVPLLLLALYGIKSTITQVKDEYMRLIKKEKYLKDGCHLRYFDNNKKQVKFEINIISGKRDGAFIEYYLDGQVKVNANYNIGEFNGPHKTYYENDKKSKDCNYEKGELHGEYKEYHENGNLKLQTQYKKGTQTGETKSFYDNGKKSKDCNYEKGELHGEYKEYHENGNLKSQTQYKKGTQTGETKSFYNNGNIYREVNCVNGEYEGEIKEYFKNGNLKFIKNEAKYTFFDEVQKHILFDGNLSLVDGVWNSYRNDGTIEYQLSFEDKKGKSLKIIFTKSGEFYSKKYYDYKFFKGIHVNYSNEFSGQRLDSKIITKPTTVMGPPGVYNGFTVNVSQIKSIEDIIELTPIKDFENE